MKYAVRASYIADGRAVYKQWLSQRFASVADVEWFAKRAAATWLENREPSDKTGCVFAVHPRLDAPAVCTFYTDVNGVVRKMKGSSNGV